MRDLGKAEDRKCRFSFPARAAVLFLSLACLFSGSGRANAATESTDAKAENSVSGTAGLRAAAGTSSRTSRRWARLRKKYRNDDSVNQLVFVQYLGGSRAEVLMYDKTDKGRWKKILTCRGYVGKNGINKKREGDGKTPTGTFRLTSGFGIKKNPGTSMPYVRVNRYLYWCADRPWYNQLIDIRKHPHRCSGEHLISYRGWYDYGMFLDYNASNKWKKGSAIFLHCTNGSHRTSGCIAVSQSSMIRILQAAEPGARICIYRK